MVSPNFSEPRAKLYCAHPLSWLTECVFLKTNEFKIKMNEIKYLIWKGTAWVSRSSPSQALRLRLHARVSEPVPTLLLFHLSPPPRPKDVALRLGRSGGQRWGCRTSRGSVTSSSEPCCYSPLGSNSPCRYKFFKQNHSKMRINVTNWVAVVLCEARCPFTAEIEFSAY